MKSADLRWPVRVDSQVVADRVLAEVWAAGALGVEERAEPDSVELIIYLNLPSESAVREALAPFSESGLVIGEQEAVSDLDWSEAWKEGLVAIEISPRLVVRPSFVEHALGPRQREVVVDPGQAFGTGGHESTRLILEWLDVLVEEGSEPRRVLDVGTGSGILALAALKLGAGSALGFDLDLDAIREARGVVHGNGMTERFELFAGSIRCLSSATFDLVLVNLLRTEMLPIASEIAETLGRGANLVLSGLLEEDRSSVLEVFAQFGLEERSERCSLDASGGVWISPLLGFPD
jgi:ribosomal protein L11 methyltransferase